MSAWGQEVPVPSAPTPAGEGPPHTSGIVISVQLLLNPRLQASQPPLRWPVYKKARHLLGELLIYPIHWLLFLILTVGRCPTLLAPAFRMHLAHTMSRDSS